jgi:hypothetical protein
MAASAARRPPRSAIITDGTVMPRRPRNWAGRRAFFLTFSITQHFPARCGRCYVTGLVALVSEVPVDVAGSAHPGGKITPDRARPTRLEKSAGLASPAWAGLHGWPSDRFARRRPCRVGRPGSVLRGSAAVKSLSGAGNRSQEAAVAVAVTWALTRCRCSGESQARWPAAGGQCAVRRCIRGGAEVDVGVPQRR